MLLVEYFTTEDATYVFGVREDWTAPKVATVHARLAGMRSYAAANFSLEEPQAAGVRATTQSKVSSLNLQEWQRRFGPFIDPILSWAEPGDYVYLVPHDVRHYLPLHALMAGGLTLLERNPALYTPSASILHICRTKRKGSRKTILILADSDATRPLPHARAEALQVAGLFGTHPYLGELATKSLVRQKLNDERNTIDILHFACHGSFHPEQALKSGILVAPEPNAPQAAGAPMLDGLSASRFLTAEEFFQLDMNTDHVTLSACESGVNQLQPGDELFGLMRDRLAALGAQPDPAIPVFDHPFWWAPFVLIRRL